MFKDVPNVLMELPPNVKYARLVCLPIKTVFVKNVTKDVWNVQRRTFATTVTQV
jgi:hypothetical protein